MIRQLEDREVMLGAAAFAITDQRRKVGHCGSVMGGSSARNFTMTWQVVDFSDAVDLHPYGFLYRKPTVTNRARLFIDPYN